MITFAYSQLFIVFMTHSLEFEMEIYPTFARIIRKNGCKAGNFTPNRVKRQKKDGNSLLSVDRNREYLRVYLYVYILIAMEDKNRE